MLREQLALSLLQGSLFTSQQADVDVKARGCGSSEEPQMRSPGNCRMKAWSRQPQLNFSVYRVYTV